MSTQDILIPNIGDFDEVDVIEVLINPGDHIELEQSLITVESDKASMEIPSSHTGVVKEVLVKVGDKVAEGSAIVRVELTTEQATSVEKKAQTDAGSTPQKAVAESAAISQPLSSGEVSENAYDVVVIGAGPGGYSAAFRAADIGLKVAIIERYQTLGGVCLNVGCIPSKALLHTVGVFEAAKELIDQGIQFGEASIDIDKLRSYKDGVIGKLTKGLAGMAKARKVEVITGVANFTGPNQLQVKSEENTLEVSFKSAIIAAGSQSVKLPFLPDDPRIVDSTGALELKSIPQKMLVIGGGIIGLEMGTVYSGLGTRLDVVEMQPILMQGADRDLVRVWQNMNKHRFDHIMLNTKTVAAEAKEDGIWVTFEGEGAPTEPQRYDLVLQAVGRSPNGKNIAAEKAGVKVDERGFIAVDNQMRTNVSHIFAIGDIVGQPMLAHKAVHEGHVAAEVISGEKAYFDARVIPSVAYTDPEVAWVGLTEEEAKEQNIAVEKGLFPWQASGRAIANNRDEGFTKLLFDAETKRILGGGIVGVGAGDLISEVVLAIEMGADQVDIASTIHPHPTLGESVGMAAEASLGACTDLPPVRRK